MLMLNATGTAPYRYISPEHFATSDPKQRRPKARRSGVVLDC